MAKTIIDELIVTLGLDPKKFNQGQREAIDALRKAETETNRLAGKIGEGQGRTAASIGKTAKASASTAKTVKEGEGRIAAAMERTSNQATRTAGTLVARGREGAGFFKGLTEAALGFGAAMAGVRTIQDALGTMTGAAALGRMAANADIATSKVSAFGLMAKRFAGGSAEQSSADLAGMVNSLTTGYVTGQISPMVPILTRLGVSIPDAMHRPMLAMRQLAHVFHHIPKPVALAYGEKLGFSIGTINLLEQGRAAFDKNLASVRKLGVTTGHAAHEMEALQTALAGVDAASKTLGRNLLVDLAPKLIRVANVIKDLETGNWQALNRDLAPSGHRTATGALTQVFTGSTKAEQAAAKTTVQYFEGHGYTKNQAIGIAANVQAESSFDPKAYNPAKGGHYGLVQWSQARREQILAATGIDVKTASYRKQLEAIAWELTHTQTAARAALLKSRSAAGAAATVRQFYEEPGGSGPLAARRRMIIANRIADRLNGTTPIITLINPGARVIPPAAKRHVPDLPASVTALVSHLRAIQPHHTINDNRSHTETHIGTVTVHTKATDPKGVAGAIKHLGTTANLASQANRGLM